MATPNERTTMTDEQLRDAVVAAVGTRERGDNFFGQFQYVQDLFNGNYSASLNHGLSILNQCQLLAPTAYEQIHKGTPYYWLGTAAFLVHDYQTAAFFFDAGASEDIRLGADPITNSTPGLRFIQIEGDQPNQAAVRLVQETQTRVERAITRYNARPGKPAGLTPLQLNEVQTAFLRRALSPGYERLRSLATAFISFFLEWDYRSLMLRLRVGEGTDEPFFLHLFKGCLLFESLLKANPRNAPPRGGALGAALQHVHTNLGTPHDINIGGVDFPTIVASVSAANDSIVIAVEYTGKLRNTVGHDLGWQAPLDPATYDRLAAMVASSCLHAIACLYR